MHSELIQAADAALASNEANTTAAIQWQARALFDLMREISEVCWCAGWMMGNEYRLGEMVTGEDAKRTYGQDSVWVEEVADMAAMSKSIGGWVGHSGDPSA